MHLFYAVRFPITHFEIEDGEFLLIVRGDLNALNLHQTSETDFSSLPNGFIDSKK